MSLLLATSSPSLANEIPKTGNICKKANQTFVISNIKYKCKKSGGKLRWTKDTKITELASNPEIIFTPWATKITQQSLIKAAQDNFTFWYEQHKGTTPNFNFYKDPIFTNTDTDWIVKSASLAASTFSYIRSDVYNVLVGATDSWALATMQQNGIPIPREGYACGFPAPAQCSDTRNSFFMIIPRIPQLGQDNADQFIPPAHEYFHLVQGKLVFPNKIREDETMPAWFVEGSANFFGYSILAKTGIETYESGRILEINRAYSKQPYAPLSQFTANQTNQNKNVGVATNPYGIGAVATEYIVASVGVDKFLKIFLNMGLNQDFPVAFENATSISLLDFYTKFELIRDAAGIPHGL